ncbi:MAG TPA: hypothetical protein VFJ85_16135 [Acidimicrobiales bacterium]|nr:hypothetical protein [Acidimicrobiales bacterium]
MPGGSATRRLVTSPATLIAVLAAAPSVAWAIAGAGYISDDFSQTYQIRETGVIATTRYLGRPLNGLFHAFLAAAVGERPFARALILAGLNAVLAVAVWYALRTVVSPTTAFIAAVLFAVVPNRAATRLWFVCDANVAGVILVAVGAVVLLRHNRIVWAVSLFLAGMLLFEGGAGLAGAAVAWWWWAGDRRARSTPALVAMAALGATALALVVASPKRAPGSPPHPFHDLWSIGPGTFGLGFWGSKALGAVGTLAVLLVCGWAAAAFLPSFRRPGSPLRNDAVAGACLVVAGAAPFAVGSSPFAVTGVFDRNNLVSDIGACVLVAALLAVVVRWQPRLGWLLTGAVVVVLAAANPSDIAHWRAAVIEGRTLERRVVADVDPSAGDIVVVPPLPGTNGVAQFIEEGDLRAALILHHGAAWSSVSMPGFDPTCAELRARAAVSDRPLFVYDRITRRLSPATDAGICRHTP